MCADRVSLLDDSFWRENTKVGCVSPKLSSNVYEKKLAGYFISMQTLLLTSSDLNERENEKKMNGRN